VLEGRLKVIAAVEQFDKVPQCGGLKNVDAKFWQILGIISSAYIMFAVFLGNLCIVLA